LARTLNYFQCLLITFNIINMETQIETLHFDADKELDNFVREKVDRMVRLYDRVEHCKVILRIDKNDKKRNKIAEIYLLVPGNKLFAQSQAETFEQAVDETIDEMKRQLQKHKAKLSHH
jgi:putative sigma-54 modulation protein